MKYNIICETCRNGKLIEVKSYDPSLVSLLVSCDCDYVGRDGYALPKTQCPLYSPDKKLSKYAIPGGDTMK